MVAYILFLNWLFPKADLGPISYFFFLICIVVDKSKPSQSREFPEKYTNSLITWHVKFCPGVGLECAHDL